MRLDKYAAFAAASRKEIKKLILKGRVTVNGTVVRDCGFSVDERDIVALDGNRIYFKEFIYLMMNKPAGVISATFDPVHKTVIDLLPEEFRRFEPFPVGRLDIDTQGLLLLTNDGKLAHNLLSPVKKVPKVYEATVDGKITEKHIDIFKNGIVLDDGYKTKPAALSVLKEDSNTVARVMITEGKNHQVKRMFADINMHVLYLKRIRFANLSLDISLKSGNFRELNDEELSILTNLMQ